ncbi:MAG: TIGR03936 family radical SAM-associated protein [Gemmiger sp.]|nr:TIGR03936 family radical SAM-associated protein [Gemmiger sp.]
MTTVRIWFEKRGEAAYISLLDLQRVMHRALKRSGLPVWYTLGFNPHIYLTFACPLSLGQESLCESCDVKTEAEPLDLSGWQDALSACLPRGLVVKRVAPVGDKAAAIAYSSYAVTMPATAAPLLEAYNAAESAPVTKKTKSGPKTLDLKAHLPKIEYRQEEDTLYLLLCLPAGDGLNLNPALLLEHLKTYGELPIWQCSILRTGLYKADKTEFC